MTTLVLVRHGEIVRPIGTSNFDHAPLSDEGTRQIQQLAATWPGPRPRVLLASPLRRSIETARLLARVFGLSIRKRPCLTEWTADTSGVSQEEYKALERVAWSDLDFVPPSGESLAQAASRGRRCLGSIAEDFAGETVAVVGHGTLFSLVTAALKGEHPTEAYKNSIRFASAAIVQAGSALRLMQDFQVYGATASTAGPDAMMDRRLLPNP